MKKKIKILTLCSLSFLLFMTSCEKDLYVEAISRSNIKISKVSIKDPLVFNNKLLMNEIQKIKNKQNFSISSSSKIVYDSINDFYFDDENGIVIEKDGKTSYTFPIFRENNVDDKVENIVFDLDSNNEYSSFVVKYDFTKEELNAMNQLNFSERDYGETNCTQLTGRVMVQVCVEKVVSACSGDPWDCGGAICGFETIIECYSINTGGGGVSGGESGGFESGTISNGPISTSPIGGHPSGNNNSNKIPCTLVKKLKKDFAFKAKLGTLKNSASSDNFERYSVVYNDPTPNIQPGQEDAYDYEDFQGVANAQGGTYSGNSTMQAVLHSHYQGLNSIFSPDDLQDMYNQMVYPDITDEFFIAVVTAEGTAYILQVVDRQAFINFGNQYLNNDDNVKDFTKRVYKKKYNLTSDNKVANEKNFLQMMTDLNMGVSLAGATYNQSAPTSPSLFSNLQVKEIDDLTLTVKNINCN